MTDYLMTTKQFLDALARTESVNDPRALGDFDSDLSPHAFGRWQIHADRLINLARRYNIWPTLGESHDSWHRRLMTAFYENYCSFKTPEEIAVRHHLGHWADPATDAAYVERFRKYAQRLESA